MRTTITTAISKIVFYVGSILLVFSILLLFLVNVVGPFMIYCEDIESASWRVNDHLYARMDAIDCDGFDVSLLVRVYLYSPPPAKAVLVLLFEPSYVGFYPLITESADGQIAITLDSFATVEMSRDMFGGHSVTLLRHEVIRPNLW